MPHRREETKIFFKVGLSPSDPHHEKNCIFQQSSFDLLTALCDVVPPRELHPVVGALLAVVREQRADAVADPAASLAVGHQAGAGVEHAVLEEGIRVHKVVASWRGKEEENIIS